MTGQTLSCLGFVQIYHKKIFCHIFWQNNHSEKICLKKIYGLFYCDKFEETQNKKVSGLSKLHESYFNTNMETFSVKTIKLIRNLIKKCEFVKEKKRFYYLLTYLLFFSMPSHFTLLKNHKHSNKLSTHNWLAITVKIFQNLELFQIA